MSTVTCPHCRTEVPHGATVCKGCQAEIEYGVPGFLFVVVLVVSIILGVKVAGVLPEAVSFLAWIVGIVAFGGGSYLLTKMFGDRINFKRIYRTK